MKHLKGPLNAMVKRRWRPASLLYAIGLQAGLLMLTVYIAILRPEPEPEPQFVAKPSPPMPQRELEHRAAVAEFLQAAAQPMALERLSVASLTAVNLPPLPATPRAEVSLLAEHESLSQDAQALLGESGLLSAGGVGARGSAAAFFGVEDSGQRIVLVVNTSASVVRKARNAGVTLERLQSEVIQLVSGLESGALFGIVQFSQGSRTFADFLAPATQANKEAAAAWVTENLRGNPAIGADQRLGHEGAFEAAFAFEPDVLFLVTDGSLNRREGSPGNYSYPEIPYTELMRSVRSLRRGMAKDARIHVIGFEMKSADADGMRRLARECGGQLREFSGRSAPRS
jgi:hypothetical protein